MHRPSKRDWAYAAGATFLFAFLMTLAGLLPGRVMIPLDHPRDLAAWKADPNTRYAISNKILSDPVYEYYAWDVEVRRLIAGGEMPWRNRWAADGAHLFANPETVLLFPATWPRLMFGARGWAVTVLLKLWLAALGMWWLSTLLTGRPRLAILAGIAYACCGYATVWLLFPHINVLGVLPWLMATLLRFLEEPRRGNAAALIGTAALATAGGHPETLFHGVLAIAAFAIPFAIRRRVTMRTAFTAIAAAACGFLLLSIQLVPFALALKKSDIVVTRAAEAHAGFRPFAIAAQVLPGFLGSPLRGELDLSGIRQPAAENFNERTAGFIGAITLLLIALGWKHVEKEHRIAIAIGVVALLIAWQLPLLRNIVGALPLFSISANHRIAFVFAFFASATLPAFIAVSQQQRRIGIALATLATIVTLGAVAVALPQSRPILMSTARRGIENLRARSYLNKPAHVYEERLDGYITGARGTVVRRVALPAFCIALAGIALARRNRRIELLTLAIAIEMLGFSWGYNPAIRDAEVARIPPAIETVRQRDPANTWLIAAANGVYDANLGTIHRVRDVRSYDVLQTHERISRLAAAGFDRNSRAFPPALNAAQIDALAKLGVRWFLSPDGTVVEIPNAATIPWPKNEPPDGLMTGAIVTLLALIAAAILLRWTS
ncbi:MAG: hypothetical protein ACJ74H_05825 [Thermoanaerobaculia bacterium]